MNALKFFLFFLAAVGFFAMGVGAMAMLWPVQPSALRCADGPHETPIDNAARERALQSDQWRWATDEETYDVYVPTPCPYQVDQRFGGGPCERGIAAWRMGPGKQEKRDRDIEWVRVQNRNLWMPARSDLEAGRIVVFDGMEVHMAPVPAGGKNLGTIVVKR